MDAVYLNKWRTAVLQEFKTYPGIQDLEFSQRRFDYDCALGSALLTKILTQNIEQYKWPKDWKEAVKERWLPAWVLKRFPVKYTIIDVKAIYPKAELPHPVFKAVEVKL